MMSVLTPKADKRREIERPRRGDLSEKSVSCFDQAAACAPFAGGPRSQSAAQVQFGCLVCITSSWPSSSSGTKPEPPHVGHCCSSSVPFSMTPSPLQSGQVFMGAPHGDPTIAASIFAGALLIRRQPNLLRLYSPRGTDLSRFSQADLNKIALGKPFCSASNDWATVPDPIRWLDGIVAPLDVRFTPKSGHSAA